MQCVCMYIGAATVTDITSHLPNSLYLFHAGALLGNMSYIKGVPLKCHHEKDSLVWEALVSLPWQPSYAYRCVSILSRVFSPWRPAPCACNSCKAHTYMAATSLQVCNCEP